MRAIRVRPDRGNSEILSPACPASLADRITVRINGLANSNEKNKTKKKKHACVYKTMNENARARRRTDVFTLSLSVIYALIFSRALSLAPRHARLTRARARASH